MVLSRHAIGMFVGEVPLFSTGISDTEKW